MSLKLRLADLNLLKVYFRHAKFDLRCSVTTNFLMECNVNHNYTYINSMCLSTNIYQQFYQQIYQQI